MILYLYFDFSTIKQIEELQKLVIDKIKDGDKIKIITNLEEIKLPEPINTYVILDNYLLYPFISNPQNIKGTIFIDKSAYYKTYLKMNNSQEKLLENYKIELFDKNTINAIFKDKYTTTILNGVYPLTNKNTLIISKKKCINKKKVESMEEFYFYSKVFYYFLPENNKDNENKYSHKFPNKLIENITMVCVCGLHYIYIPKKKGDIICQKDTDIISPKRLKISAE